MRSGVLLYRIHLLQKQKFMALYVFHLIAFVYCRFCCSFPCPLSLTRCTFVSWPTTTSPTDFALLCWITSWSAWKRGGCCMRGSLDQRFVPNESGYLVDFYKEQQTSADMGILVKFLYGVGGRGVTQTCSSWEYLCKDSVQISSFIHYLRQIKQWREFYWWKSISILTAWARPWSGTRLLTEAQRRWNVHLGLYRQTPQTISCVLQL